MMAHVQSTPPLFLTVKTRLWEGRREEEWTADACLRFVPVGSGDVRICNWKVENSPRIPHLDTIKCPQWPTKWLVDRNSELFPIFSTHLVKYSIVDLDFPKSWSVDGFTYSCATTSLQMRYFMEDELSNSVDSMSGFCEEQIFKLIVLLDGLLPGTRVTSVLHKQFPPSPSTNSTTRVLTKCQCWNFWGLAKKVS